MSPHVLRGCLTRSWGALIVLDSSYQFVGGVGRSSEGRVHLVKKLDFTFIRKANSPPFVSSLLRET